MSIKTIPGEPLYFSNGSSMKNRFMLAPLTNQQSHENGQLSDEEFHWLTMRAEGQFGLVMTCASHVQAVGKGFSGQLGIFDDMHIKGHQRLSTAIKSYGSLAVIQLHHAGMRSPLDVIGQQPVCPSDNVKTGARALTIQEVEELRDDFIDAALRSQKSGYDGVEVHGAHGYILTQFISKEINKRTDSYGGSLENRSRLLFEIIEGIRAQCGNDFLVGVRLSPEKFGMELAEVKTLCKQLAEMGSIDFLDISLWDSFKLPEEEQFRNISLLEHFTSLDLKKVKLTVAGKIRTGKEVQQILDTGVDFVTIGRSAILHHDFPVRVMEDPSFIPFDTPVPREHLRKEGLSDMFIGYMKRWPDFVAEDD
ncbi:NADH:flavin oxidoreductase [Lutimonas sp.]|uniref:NADH:flavin oxidoreductase n=1 Tax=Lutimonas sp. TaxID=1872403 RepID=UPI003D9BF0D1